MKKFILFLFISFGVFSAEKADECKTPGEQLSKEFSYKSGEMLSQTIRRDGSASNFNKFESDQFDLITDVFAHYNITTCQTRNYVVDKEVCAEIDPDIALGKGNQFFKEFFDLKISIAIRADKFSKLLFYSENLSNPERLIIARDIIENFVEWSLTNAIPYSASEYEKLIGQVFNNGTIDELTANELITATNKKRLGFIAPKNVKVSESDANEIFFKLFNIGLDIDERTKIIQESFNGIEFNDEKLKALATDFILYANLNGIPSQWSEVVSMLRYAKENQTIEQKEFSQSTGLFEVENRIKIGFSLTALECSIVDEVKQYNAVMTSVIKEYSNEANLEYKIIANNGLLLEGEQENFIVRYNGIEKPVIFSESSLNKYELISADIDQNGTVNFILNGERIKKSPSNTIEGFISLTNGSYKLSLKDLFKHTQFVESTLVNAVFYESINFWPDRKIKTMQFELENIEDVFDSKIAKLKKDRKIYVEIQIQRESVLFNKNYSSKKTISEK